jgi:hypothetical protein
MKASIVLSTLLATLALGCGAPSDSSVDASSTLQNGPITCTIKTVKGYYLTAVGGGGRVTDVLHTDATQAQAWEKFVLIDSGSGMPNIQYGFRTKTGNYLTVVGGGGRITDVIHSNATQLLDWEKMQLESIGGGWFGIKTVNGHYLTAVGGGGRITDVIHSDATQIRDWEKFKFDCVSGG